MTKRKFFSFILGVEILLLTPCDKKKIRAENINCDSVAMRCISINRPVTRPLRKFM